MKNKILKVLIGVSACALLLVGCSSKPGEPKGNIDTKFVSLKGYNGIKVDQVEQTKVTDEQVQSTIDSKLDALATEKEVDRAAKKGDVVNINYKGKVNGKLFDGGSADNTDLTLGSGQFIEGFEDQIIGHKAGETFDVNVTFPKDYQSTNLAGKKAVFTTTINKVSLKTTPKLNKDTIKKLKKQDDSIKASTVKAYKAEVKKNLESDAKKSADSQLQSSVWTKVVGQAKIKSAAWKDKDIKKELDNSVESTVKSYKDYAKAQGTTYVKFLQTQLQSDEKDEKKLEAQLTEIITKQAKDSIKQNLVADAIAKKEKLEPSEKEYKKELKNVAKDYSMTDVDQLEQAAKQAWPDNYKDQLKSMVNLKIVTNWLAEHCIQEKASTTSSESK